MRPSGVEEMRVVSSMNAKVEVAIVMSIFELVEEAKGEENSELDMIYGVELASLSAVSSGSM